MGDPRQPPGPAVAHVPPSPAPAEPAGAVAHVAVAVAAPTGEARSKAAKAFFQSLRKGVRQLAMYPGDPARLAALVRSLCAPLGPLLAGGPIPVAVQPESFTFEREPVWSAEGTDDTPGRFHKAGVRSLCLLPGLGEDELSRLLSILLTQLGRGAEDPAALLFDASLEHVDVQLSDRHAFGGLTEAQLELAVAQQISDLQRRQATITPESYERVFAAVRLLDQKLETLENPQSPFVVQGQVSAGWREKARLDCERDLARRLAPQLTARVVAALHAGALGDPARASELVVGLVDSMLHRADLSALPMLLDGLGADGVPHSAALLAAVAQKLSEKPRIDLLGPLLNAAHPDLGAVARYLAECKSAAAPHLLALLPGLEPRHSRLLVLEAVAALDKGAGAALADRLDVEGAGVVADLLALVERLPAVERGRLFDRAIRHKLAEVRVAAVESLAHTTTPEAMHRFVLDATKDHESAVRAAALRTLVKLSPMRAAADLVRLTKLPDWEKRDAREKELIFECLGRTETDEAIAYANSLLHVPKKGLFGHKRVELKLLALRALRHMPNLQAFKALQSAAAMPDQDPEIAAEAPRAATAVREAMLGAQTEAAKPAVAGHEPLPAELERLFEQLRRRVAARLAAAAPTAAAPPAPPAAAHGAAPAAAADPLLEFPEPAAAPPAWATPGPTGPKKSGGGS